MGRIVVETAGDRRITREYDDAGRLLRILIEPVSRGPTADAPPVERQAPPPRAAAAPKAKAAAPPAPAATAPAAQPAPQEELPVTLAPIEPEPERAPLRPPTAAPPAAPKPKGFAIVAVERVEAAPAPPTLDETIERDVGTLEAAPPAPAPDPPPEAARATEPAAAPPPRREPDPAPPASLEVPDLEARVDAVFAQRAQRSKAKKRAPLPVPQFAPLKREPWEDRLERLLSSS